MRSHANWRENVCLVQKLGHAAQQISEGEFTTSLFDLRELRGDAGATSGRLNPTVHILVYGSSGAYSALR